LQYFDTWLERLCVGQGWNRHNREYYSEDYEGNQNHRILLYKAIFMLRQSVAEPIRTSFSLKMLAPLLF